jgi:hypothetical protein
MKTIILLLVSAFGFSQPYVSTSLDARNGIIGSDPTKNKAELDILIRAGVVAFEGVGKNVKVGFVYEKFNAIDFKKYAFEIGYNFDGTRVVIQPSLEFGFIERDYLNYWTYGGNLDFIYYFRDSNIGLIATCNLSSRTDLNALYGGNNYKFSNYIGLIYKFD